MRLAVAAGSAVLAVALTHLAWPVLRPTPFILGLAAAILSAWARGRAAGFLATLFAAVGFVLFPPSGSSPPPGVPGFLVVAGTFSYMVARRYEIEANLRSSESRLAEAQHVAHIGSWEWRIRDNHVWWSDEACRVFGMNEGDFDPCYQAFIERVHPDDRARVHEVNQHCFQHQEPFEVEHRIVRPDGGVRTILSKGRVALDEHGTAEREWEPLRTSPTRRPPRRSSRGANAVSRRSSTRSPLGEAGVARRSAPGNESCGPPHAWRDGRRPDHPLPGRRRDSSGRPGKIPGGSSCCERRYGGAPRVPDLQSGRGGILGRFAHGAVRRIRRR